MLPTLNMSSLISPAMLPVPNVTSTPKLRGLYVVDRLLLNEAWVLHDGELQREEVTHKLPLPVSKMTGSSCGGVPIFIIPVYCALR